MRPRKTIQHGPTRLFVQPDAPVGTASRTDLTETLSREASTSRADTSFRHIVFAIRSRSVTAFRVSTVNIFEITYLACNIHITCGRDIQSLKILAVHSDFTAASLPLTTFSKGRKRGGDKTGDMKIYMVKLMTPPTAPHDIAPGVHQHEEDRAVPRRHQHEGGLPAQRK